MTDTLLIIILIISIHFLMVLFALFRIRRSGLSDQMKLMWAVFVSVCPLLGFIAFLLLAGNLSGRNSREK